MIRRSGNKLRTASNGSKFTAFCFKKSVPDCYIRDRSLKQINKSKRRVLQVSITEQANSVLYFYATEVKN